MTLEKAKERFQANKHADENLRITYYGCPYAFTLAEDGETLLDSKERPVTLTEEEEKIQTWYLRAYH